MTYLEDQSANGTFVNDRVVGKGRKIPLAHVAKIALSLPHNKGRQLAWHAQTAGGTENLLWRQLHTPLSTFVLWGSRAIANSEMLFHPPGTPHMSPLCPQKMQLKHKCMPRAPRAGILQGACQALPCHQKRLKQGLCKITPWLFPFLPPGDAAQGMQS